MIVKMSIEFAGKKVSLRVVNDFPITEPVARAVLAEAVNSAIAAGNSMMLEDMSKGNP